MAMAVLEAAYETKNAEDLEYALIIGLSSVLALSTKISSVIS